ncbi:hypothetical protein HKCCE2091_05410 [Rhodobacterales bacterium HKCCE2091]|nr:hypothetical protein [Rhodobacterales bacterium HKCCE2091]
MTRADTVRLTLRSWAFGLVAAGLLLFPLNIAGDTSIEGSRALIYLFTLPSTLAMTFTMGAVVTLPLLALALAAALAFRDRIALYPVASVLAVMAAGPLLGMVEAGVSGAPVLQGAVSRMAVYCALCLGVASSAFVLGARQGSDSQSATPPGRIGRK